MPEHLVQPGARPTPAPPRAPCAPAPSTRHELSPSVRGEATGPTEPGTLGRRCHQNCRAAQRAVVAEFVHQ